MRIEPSWTPNIPEAMRKPICYWWMNYPDKASIEESSILTQVRNTDAGLVLAEEGCSRLSYPLRRPRRPLYTAAAEGGAPMTF